MMLTASGEKIYLGVRAKALVKNILHHAVLKKAAGEDVDIRLTLLYRIVEGNMALCHHEEARDIVGIGGLIKDNVGTADGVHIYSRRDIIKPREDLLKADVHVIYGYHIVRAEIIAPVDITVNTLKHASVNDVGIDSAGVYLVLNCVGDVGLAEELIGENINEITGAVGKGVDCNVRAVSTDAEGTYAHVLGICTVIERNKEGRHNRLHIKIVCQLYQKVVYNHNAV